MGTDERRDKPQNSWAESSDERGVTACHWAVTRSRDEQLGSAAMLERCRCSDEDRNSVCRSQARCRLLAGVACCLRRLWRWRHAGWAVGGASRRLGDVGKLEEYNWAM